jgi:hypothetical protein
LALVACVLAAYSISCYFFVSAHWRFFLRKAAVANLAYAIVSILLVIKYYPLLSIWGLLYFLLESVVILFLVLVEWKNSAPAKTSIG